MWCLIYIAIAGAAPPTDCSHIYEEQCLFLATTVNNLNWREDMEEIPYLAQCISTQEKAKYLEVKLRTKMIERAEAWSKK